jgi:hypothetical protein
VHVVFEISGNQAFRHLEYDGQEAAMKYDSRTAFGVLEFLVAMARRERS